MNTTLAIKKMKNSVEGMEVTKVIPAIIEKMMIPIIREVTTLILGGIRWRIRSTKVTNIVIAAP